MFQPASVSKSIDAKALQEAHDPQITNNPGRPRTARSRFLPEPVRHPQPGGNHARPGGPAATVQLEFLDGYGFGTFTGLS